MQKKYILIGALVLVLGVGVGQILDSNFLKTPKTSTKPSNENNNSPIPTTKQEINSVTLNFSEETRTVEKGVESTADILINPNRNSVSNSDLYVKYDPTKLEIIGLEPGTFFQNPLIFNQNVATESGTATLAFGSVESASESGTLATVRFIPYTTGATELSIGKESIVVAKGPVEVLIESGSPLKITVNK